MNTTQVSIGLLASDNTGWQEGHRTYYQNSTYSIVWNTKRPVGIEDTIQAPQATIGHQGYFDLYYLQQGQAHYKAEMVDIATTDAQRNAWKAKYRNKITDLYCFISVNLSN